MIIRNINLPKLSINDKLQLILRSIENDNQRYISLYPFVHDFIHLLESTRTDLLLRSGKNKKIINALDEIIFHFNCLSHAGDGEKVDGLLSTLKKSINQYIKSQEV